MSTAAVLHHHRKRTGEPLPSHRQVRPKKPLAEQPKAKALFTGSYCHVYAAPPPAENQIIKVMENDDAGDETAPGLCQSQLRECEFYFRLAEQIPQILPCELVDVKRHSITLRMPHIHMNVWDMSRDHNPQLMGILDFLIDDLTRALHRIHLSGLLHRDIKPSNVLFDSTQVRFYLIDFGSMGFEPLTTRTTHWCTEMFCAPECDAPRRTGHYSFASDIFSLGATLLSIILQHIPDDNEQFDWHAFALASKKWPTQLSPHIRSVLLASVHPHPDQRCSLAEIRECFHKRTNEESSWNTPLPWKTPEALSLEVLREALKTKRMSGPQVMDTTYRWMAETCREFHWDKMTLLTAIQVFNDYVGTRLGKVMPIRAMAITALTLAQHLLEDNDVADWRLVPKDSSLPLHHLQKLQFEMWLSLGCFLVRRPLLFAFRDMEWSDLVYYALHHSL